MSASKHIKNTFKSEYSRKDERLWKHYKQKLIDWRKEPVVITLEKPTNIARARELGYKAKQGVIVARVRVKRGKRLKTRPKARRRPKRFGIRKISPGKSLQRMAEERVTKKYTNLEVLNSYWVGEDGVTRWFEVILIDPEHPAIKSDKDLNWICNKTARAERGLTSAGIKGRGLRK